ncbi:hypothetical protein PG987_009193 [Apiospora arundinis]
MVHKHKHITSQCLLKKVASPLPLRPSPAVSSKTPPGSGKGADKIDSGDKKGEMKDQLAGLSSNPKGVLDDAVDAKFSKTTEPGAKSS